MKAYTLLYFKEDLTNEFQGGRFRKEYGKANNRSDSRGF